MADFFEEEAEVSDEDAPASSDEEEEEYEEDIDEGANVPDLINDDEEVENDSEGEEIGRKKKRKHRDYDERLEDEDYDLIEENLGVKVERKKFRRVRQISEEDDSGSEDGGAGTSRELDDRDAIAKEIFAGEEEEGELSPGEAEDLEEQHEVDQGEQYGALEESDEESDPDDFIVDDSGQPIGKKKKKGHKHRYTDSALQEAQDIFGLDFDFDEFEGYGDDYEEAEEEEYSEYEDEEEELEEGGEQRRRQKRPGKKRAPKKSIYEVFEPSELERGHFTDLDNEIKTADIPERFMLRTVPVTEAADEELEKEAEWIYKQAFLTPSVSNQEFGDQGDGYGGSSGYERKPPKTKKKIREALLFMRNQHFEVPFIAFYRKEYVEPELNFNDLYKVYHWDAKWCQLKARKANLLKLFEKMQTYQFDTVMKDKDFDAELPEDFRALSNQDIERLNAVDSTESLKDVYMHFLLYYGRELPKMHNSLKAKPKEKKMKMVTVKRKVMVKRWRKKKKEKSPHKERRIEDDDSDEEEDSNKKMDTMEEKEKEDEEKMDTEDGEKGDEEGGEEKKKKDEEEDDGFEDGETKDKEEGEEGEEGETKEKDKEDGEVAEEEEMEEIEVETEVEEEMEVEASDDEDDEEGVVTSYEIKQASRKSMYALCQDAKLTGLAAKFGLTPEQFGENLRDNYQRHDPEQHQASPLEAASEYLSNKFKDEEGVLKAARYMVALQIAHDPLVRQCVRQTYYERAKISVKPTKKGIKEIDESHPIFGSKYLKNKQVKDLLGDQYLKLVQAEKDKLITMTMSIDMAQASSTSYTSATYFEEMKQLYYLDEFRSEVQAWNKERSGALEMALKSILYPQLAKELKTKLIAEAKEGIIKQCCTKMFNYLKVMPLQVDQPMEEDEDDYLDGNSRMGLRVMGFAFTSAMDSAAFCCMLDGEGEVTDFLRLPHFLRRRNAFWQRDRDLKEADVESLKTFISNQKPHVIAVASEGRNTTSVLQDIRGCIEDLESEQQMAPIKVQLLDSNVAVVYQASKLVETEFRDYPPLLRQAVSIARRLQDPLIEFSRLCNPDDDLLCLKLHPQQEAVSQDELKEALHQEFIYRVNEVGVDINRAILHPHTASLVQFICGLGPRKGNALVRTLKQKNQRLDNRNQLVTHCQLGPKVFINCAGFLKIDTASAGDGADDTYIEVLDSTRIHPETYEWARKMAVDALEYDEAADDANPAEALEEILENPDKLKDLDLDAFAEELERQGYGNRSITLYDIRAELNSRYKDLRTPFHPFTPEEAFSTLTKETPETFYRGKMVTCVVTGIARRRPTREMLDDANPSKNDETGLWLCPFCQQDNFFELNEVWSHFDTGNCPGQAVGVKVRLDNGIMGFIHTKFLSDSKVKNPEDRVKIGMTLHARIMKIDIERFQVDLTSRSSDLQDRNGEWAPPRDTYYDYEAAEMDKQKDEDEKKKAAASSTYVKRVIVHPSFQNITYKQAEKVMRESDVGDVIIRPSSKGADHLTVTWKVDDGIYQHIDVQEEGKDNDFSLGSTLKIGEEGFEDLDEIIARHIQPMAAFVRDVTSHKYYRDVEGGSKELMDKCLAAEKKKAPSRIPYFMCFCKDYPGKFLLSYQPRSKGRHEYVTITPDGYKFRGQMFTTINSLHRWFKVHFRDPIPGMNVTPTPMSTHRTPMSVAHDGTPWQTGTPMIQKTGTTFTGGMYATPSVLQGTPRQTPGRQTPLTGTAAGRYGYGYPYTTPQNITTPVGATPSYQGMRTPQGGVARTPQVNRTPQINPARTPSVAGMTPQGTPQYQSRTTPRQSWGGSTPTQQPQQAPHRSAGRTPQRSSGSSSSREMPRTGGPVDWAQQAALWAKQRQQNLRSPAVQPSPALHEPSPMSISNTPAPSQGGGDSTPLIDEEI
ncbi:transcription elongation factor SPT6-like isoform X2 [Lytechinus variegatus]|uniref:transcription elongation factor SPT6-like isoform X2 n=1 Tax=Lytechinus variegatus TaxID=7654 RepID=UPI001BB22D3D|nr:transcription elongation factor SPT6-like isoform X2 [Lytechinus variegatus]